MLELQGGKPMESLKGRWFQAMGLLLGDCGATTSADKRYRDQLP
jgi:hypothetical protein